MSAAAPDLPAVRTPVTAPVLPLATAWATSPAPAPDPTAPTWMRRARPLLGTLVDIGCAQPTAPDAAPQSGAARPGEPACGVHPGDAAALAAVESAFAALAAVQRVWSRFEPDSLTGRFNAAPAGAALELDADSVALLALADELYAASEGLFDIALGTGRWALEGGPSAARAAPMADQPACRVARDRAFAPTSVALLRKRDAGCRLDLGGLAKGHAVDRAVAALQAAGVTAGWVNAGGDLRAFGVELPLVLRDEAQGGVRALGVLRDGAFATSCFADDSRSPGRQPLAGPVRAAHVSVAAPRCAWADALTKVVAATGEAGLPLLARYDARAWIHPD